MEGLETAAKAAYKFFTTQVNSDTRKWEELPVLTRNAWVSLAGVVINSYNEYEGT